MHTKFLMGTGREEAVLSRTTFGILQFEEGGYKYLPTYSRERLLKLDFSPSSPLLV